MFPESVERWRTIVAGEIARMGLPFPADYVLGVIQRESNGNTGIVNSSSGASGLMQVMPITLDSYNAKHASKYTIDQLRSTSMPVPQIRVGIWVLSRYVKLAHDWLSKSMSNVPLDLLIKIADTFYASGPARVRKKLSGIVPTWENVKQKFPNWHRIKPAELVWSRSGNWDLSSVARWLQTQIQEHEHEIKTGAMAALLIIAIGMWIMKWW